MLRERFDVIDVQSTAPLACLAVMLIGRMKGICVVVTWHEVWREYWRDYLGPMGRLGELAEWLLSRLGRFHLANSAFTASKLSKLGIEADAYIPCGVDIKRIESAPLSDRRLDIISVSRLVPHKNQELLIEAIGLLAESGEHPSTLIVGSGPEFESIEHKIRLMELENVELLTNVDSEEELYGLLKASKVFALPSVREGFGLAIIEAAACGLPAVVVDHPDNGASELVHPDLVVPPTSSAFAESLRSLLLDDDQLAKMAKHAADVVEDYELRPIVDRLESLYLSVRARA
jgi:glycosyltransferase involved in cell wall biosynthesis